MLYVAFNLKHPDNVCQSLLTVKIIANVTIDTSVHIKLIIIIMLPSSPWTVISDTSIRLGPCCTREADSSAENMDTGHTSPKEHNSPSGVRE